MKKLLILIFFINSSTLFCQINEERDFELVFQGSYLRGLNTGRGVEERSIFRNYYLHSELNYSLKNWIEIGAYFAYSRGDSEETIIYPGAIGISIYSGSIFYSGANLNFLPIELWDESLHKRLQPYLTLEGGYLYFDNPEPEAKPIPKNGFIYAVGAGTKLNISEKFAINGELIYSKKMLLRFGIGFKF